MKAVLKPLKSEPVSFSSGLHADALLSTLKTFQKNNSKITPGLFLRERPNLHVVAKSNYQIEITHFWQLTQLPGLGMNVKLRGMIVPDRQHSKINGTIRPNIFYPFLFWIIAGYSILLMIRTIASKTGSVMDVIYLLVFLVILEILLLLFCSYCKKKLIKDIRQNLNLTLID